jgi:parallel beta-helix repeat protein
MKICKLWIFTTLFLAILASNVMADTITDILGEAESKTYNLNNKSYHVGILLIRDWPPEKVDFTINSIHIGPLEEKESIILREGAKLIVNDIYFIFAGELGWIGIVNFTLTDPPDLKIKAKLPNVNYPSPNYTTNQIGSMTSKEKCPRLKDGMTIKKDLTLCAFITHNLPNGLKLDPSLGRFTLDCNGSTIKGKNIVGSIGLNVLNDNDDVIIINCTIMDYDKGMFIKDNTPMNKIFNNVLINNTMGISLDESSRDQIKDNYFLANDIGISLLSSDRQTIENNRFSSNNSGKNDKGIYTKYSSEVNIIKNDFEGNKLAIYLDELSANNIITKNTITESKIGIIISDKSHFNVVENNIIKESYNSPYVSSGMQITESGANQIINNTIYNLGWGLSLYDDSDLNQIINNTFFNNTEVALTVEWTLGTVVKGNKIYNNGFGIRIDESPDVLISNNDIYSNYGYNLENKDYFNITAENNWWGTINITEIQEGIYDYYDDPRKGIVDFEPFLNQSIF